MHNTRHDLAHPQQDPETEIPRHPTDTLIAVIVTLLAPLFLDLSRGDVTTARLAALETLNAYGVRNQADLLIVAQIIALSLATLASVNQSMEDEATPALALRLRANANALVRSQAQLTRSRAAIARQQDQEAQAEADRRDLQAAAGQEDETRARVAQARQTVEDARSATPPATEAARHRLAWASAAAQVAQEFLDELPDLPPAERREARLRAAALSWSATDLVAGAAADRPPPESSRNN